MKIPAWYFITFACFFCEAQYATPFNWGDSKTDTTPGKMGVISYKFNGTNGTVGRIQLQRMDGKSDAPLFAVFRDHENIMGAQVPVEINSISYSTVARSLCPFERDQELIVEVSSSEKLEFKLNASLLEWFKIRKNEPRPSYVIAAQPVFFEYTFCDGVKTVNVNIQSDSNSCMTVSVQPKMCPVFDQNNNVRSAGLHETVSTSGSIPVTRNDIGGENTFYIVFIMKGRYDSCQPEQVKLAANSETLRKEFTIYVEEAMRDDWIIAPILLEITGILVIIVIVLCFERELQVENENQYGRLPPYIEHEGAIHQDADIEREGAMDKGTMDQGAPNQRVTNYGAVNLVSTQGTSNQDATDRGESNQGAMNQNITDQGVARDSPDRHNQNVLYVSDLCKLTCEQRNNEYNKYLVSLFTISMFYFLPVVQLEWISINSIHTSGNLDACWYNFRCARPMLRFFAFNNILSNASYVVLGVLYLYITKTRITKHPQEENYGLPQNPGISYAIGLALIMVGFLSASYHVCPTKDNYQYDTSFMYIIGLLGILKTYQLRHPDSIMNAHIAFLSIALFILFVLLGIKWSHLTFFIIYAFVLLFVMLIVSTEFYFKGDWTFHPIEYSKRIVREFRVANWSSSSIQHTDRLLFLLLVNFLTLVYVIVGFIILPNDFASYLLIPFIMDLILYLLYYITMKYVHKEMELWKALLFLVSIGALWGVSIWFFAHTVSDWGLGPAQSREKNKNCIILNYFDNHDVWHFLSSIAIFMSFFLLDCIDDDLRHVRRDTIPVF